MNHNQIPLRQNEELQLRRLGAQRRLYSNAKRLLSTHILVTVALVVTWSILVQLFSVLKVYAAFYGIVAVLLDIAVLTPWQSSLKHRAAAIQELFDCYVLELPWQMIKAGVPPDTEAVVESSRSSAKSAIDDINLQNWYPTECGNVELSVGRIICQRINCWWDAKLRRRYALWVMTITASIFLLIIVLGLLGHATLDGFLLAGLIPFLPVLAIGLRQFSEQRLAAARLDDLKRHSDRLWNEVLSGTMSDEEACRNCRTLQDEIFEQRRRSPLVFDWAYKLLRREQEEQMNLCASDLVEEVRAALASHHSR